MSLTELQALERDHVVPAYARQPVEFVRGEGTRLWDADGTEYLDFQTGLAVTSLGHAHPAVVRAIFSAASLASVPEFAKCTLPPSELSARRLASRIAGSE